MTVVFVILRRVHLQSLTFTDRHNLRFTSTNPSPVFILTCCPVQPTQPSNKQSPILTSKTQSTIHSILTPNNTQPQHVRSLRLPLQGVQNQSLTKGKILMWSGTCWNDQVYRRAQHQSRQSVHHDLHSMLQKRERVVHCCGEWEGVEGEGDGGLWVCDIVMWQRRLGGGQAGMERVVIEGRELEETYVAVELVWRGRWRGKEDWRKHILMWGWYHFTSKSKLLNPVAAAHSYIYNLEEASTKWTKALTTVNHGANGEGPKRDKWICLLRNNINTPPTLPSKRPTQ